MKKRTFLKTSAVFATGSILGSNISCESKAIKSTAEPLTNWAKNLTYSTSNVDYPTSGASLQEMVKRSKKLRGLGSKHSFNKIADSKYQQICTKEMSKVIALDDQEKTLTLEAGVRYGDICEYLHKSGYALHNLASLPHISVVGACATSTHGSGVKNGGMATGIHSFKMVKADGELVNISRTENEELFNASIVGLGGLGIITEITLDLLPTFEMQQVVYQDMPMSSLENNFDEIMSSAYSVSLFTDWKNKNINEVWIKSRIDSSNIISDKEYFGGKLADRNLHPVITQSAESCTEQMGVVGAWYERLPHFKMGFTPSSGDELQAEYFVPMENGFAAMAAVEKLNKEISPHLFISEIRTIAADNFWMSPFYKKPCVSIHFTFKPNWAAVQKLMPQIETVLSPFGVRPHWGKLFTLTPAVLQSRIEKLSDFKELMLDYDPIGKFSNEFIERNLF